MEYVLDIKEKNICFILEEEPKTKTLYYVYKQKKIVKEMYVCLQHLFLEHIFSEPKKTCMKLALQELRYTQKKKKGDEQMFICCCLYINVYMNHTCIKMYKSRCIGFKYINTF